MLVRRKLQGCLTEPHPMANTANSTGLDIGITFPQNADIYTISTFPRVRGVNVRPYFDPSILYTVQCKCPLKTTACLYP